MSKKRKFSVAFFVCLTLAVVAFVAAFFVCLTLAVLWRLFWLLWLEGDKQMWAIGGAFVFGVYSLIGYSCKNAAKVPDNYV